MDTLKQIISVVSRKRISKIEIFDGNLLSTKESKFTQLYDLIEPGHVNTDKEAAELLYGDENSVNYRQLKSRFLKRLLNTLFFLDLNSANKGSDYRYNQYVCTKALMHAKLLRFFGAFPSAVRILKLKYNDAKKFEFYDLLAEYASFISQFYALTGNLKGLEVEIENYKNYLRLSNKESQAQIIYFTSIAPMSVKSVVSSEMVEKLKTGIDELEELTKDETTASMFYSLQLLKFFYYETNNDWEQLYLNCIKLDEELHDHKFYSSSKRSQVIFKKLVACLNMERFDEGIELYEKSIINISPGSNNWYITKKCGAMLALHSNNRAMLYKLYSEAVADRYMKHQKDNVQEYWKVIKAYCHFLQKLYGEEEMVKEQYKVFKRFRLFKFLNEVPTLSKDKSGMNVAILLMEYLYLLIEGNYEKIIQKIDALKVYRSRYLKGVKFKRSYTITGMLIKAEKESFLVDRVKEVCDKDYAILAKHNVEQNGEQNLPINDSEIIPYDILWQYLLKIMEFNDLPESEKQRRGSVM